MRSENSQNQIEVAIEELREITAALERWQEKHGARFNEDVTSVAAGALNQLLQSLRDQSIE